MVNVIPMFRSDLWPLFRLVFLFPLCGVVVFVLRLVIFESALSVFFVVYPSGRFSIRILHMLVATSSMILLCSRITVLICDSGMPMHRKKYM